MIGRYAGCVARLRALWGGRCQNPRCGARHACDCLKRRCGRTHLEFAHRPGMETSLVGKGRGRTDRYYDILRNPDSYVLLCRHCHWRLDFGRDHSVLPQARERRSEMVIAC